VYPRRVESQLRSALREAPVVRLSGPRASGKTTTCTHVVDQLGGSVVRLDDPAIREAVAADPSGYLDGLEPPVLIDEYQQVPAGLDVIKTSLSTRGAEPGRWLLCGSVAIEAVEQAADSLGGRIRDLRMTTLTVDERNRLPEPAFLAELIANGVGWLRGWRAPSPRDRDVVLAEAIRGGFPLLVERSPAARQRGLRDWVDASVVADAKSLDTRKVGELARLLRYYAAATGEVTLTEAPAAFPGPDQPSLRRPETSE
jgi:predicted AAA+ superfamily ATPase